MLYLPLRGPILPYAVVKRTLAFERLEIVLEPSGGSGLAALLAGRVQPLPARMGVVLSDATALALRQRR